MMQDPLKVCLVGAGRMGRIRAQLLYSNPSTSFAVVDFSETFGAALASKYRTRWYKTLPDFFAAENGCTAVWISTPTSTHELIIIEALKNDCVRFIFTEKPVGENAGKITKLFR